MSVIVAWKYLGKIPLEINLKAEKKTSFVLLLKVRLIFIKTTWLVGLRLRIVKPEDGLYYLKQNYRGLEKNYLFQTL